MFAGASNIQDGLTIDLANLNQIQVSQDRTLTHVGAGNRWIDIYRRLGDQQLAVIGGRVAGIGVGGLTLGGMLRGNSKLERILTDIKGAYLSSPVVTDGHVTMSGTTKYALHHLAPYLASILADYIPRSSLRTPQS